MSSTLSIINLFVIIFFGSRNLANNYLLSKKNVYSQNAVKIELKINFIVLIFLKIVDPKFKLKCY